jgi:hypothetical protein
VLHIGDGFAALHTKLSQLDSGAIGTSLRSLG